VRNSFGPYHVVTPSGKCSVPNAFSRFPNAVIDSSCEIPGARGGRRSMRGLVRMWPVGWPSRVTERKGETKWGIERARGIGPWWMWRG
jgi:hypothetical protein